MKVALVYLAHDVAYQPYLSITYRLFFIQKMNPSDAAEDCGLREAVYVNPIKSINLFVVLI